VEAIRKKEKRSNRKRPRETGGGRVSLGDGNRRGKRGENTLRKKTRSSLAKKGSSERREPLRKDSAGPLLNREKEKGKKKAEERKTNYP